MADDWYEKQDLGNGITRLSEPYVHRYFSANLFHVRGRDADHDTLDAEQMKTIASHYLHGTSLKAKV
jgi:hypothetical protein